MIRATRELSSTPLTGFKAAYPMISADGARTGFSGLAAGGRHVYLATDKAVCLSNSGHPVPSRMCRCGFYCLHTLDAARDLTCAPEHRDAVVLEVAASGRYRRHELGLRYETQRVRRVWTGRCRCGRSASAFVDSGTGRTGWRRLVGCCARCADGRPVLEREAFARLSGQDGLDVRGDPEPLAHFVTTYSAAPVVDAELAILNARVDELRHVVDGLVRRE
ncbi:MAG: hypothetical protein J0I34_01635 [Pseudonocardia sp.]|uniref:hypothetical protein n=1 Tax=unclassified Pseudonocardia TaxID=2619320 RepID=UPI00086DCD62|nr:MULTISPECIES: hypothetical protein [unclassified Pseudonocardia]MBN9107457.1 hypothetical protein [Pseudonocardia sp.]ODU27797.1 MAG: hypothetical protein ABS80_03070 [Pseudonocardia sp. SCN 72-51]ODV08324.1 MAG: hypothetical protein ABT15_03350 [Pseudonocardia sp. SCN 73-27]